MRLTATRFRQPIASLNVSVKARPVIQLRHSPSMMHASYRGPTKRIATSPSGLAISRGSTGHHPSSCKDCGRLVWALSTATKMVIKVVRVHDKATARMRARMTAGASRESWGEGRVLGEK